MGEVVEAMFVELWSHRIITTGTTCLDHDAQRSWLLASIMERWESFNLARRPLLVSSQVPACVETPHQLLRQPSANDHPN